MPDSFSEKELQAEEWIERATDDELVSRSILKHQDAPARMVCFHAQQMAEKYLKAFLVYTRKWYPKVHPLDTLWELCQERDSAFDAIKKDAVFLTSFYAATRYPGDVPDFTFTECSQAFDAALRIKEFILSKIKSVENSGFGLISILVAVALIALIAGGGWFAIDKETKQQQSLLQLAQQKEQETQRLKQKIEEGHIQSTSTSASSTQLNINEAGSSFFTPEYISTHSKELNGKTITVNGIVEWIPLRDSSGGLGEATPGFVASNNILTGTIIIRIYGRIQDFPSGIKQALIRGVLEIKDKAIYLYISPSCNNCITIVDNADTSNWKIYRNEKYGFEVKYPKEWDLQTEIIMGPLSSNMVGFVPPLQMFDVCSKQADFLKENYKRYNPFPGYEKYAESLARQDCGIVIETEKNPDHLSLKEFLKSNYRADDKHLGFIVEKGNIEQIETYNYTFVSCHGIGDGNCQKGIVAGGRQFTIKGKDYILFINDHLSNQSSSVGAIGKEIFQSMVTSFGN